MTADPTLADRLRLATGPNYRLGLDVIVAFVDADPMLWMNTHGDPTASVDSILALVRAVEPGVWWKLRQPFDHGDERAHAYLEADREPFAARASPRPRPSPCASP